MTSVKLPDTFWFIVLIWAITCFVYGNAFDKSTRKPHFILDLIGW